MELDVADLAVPAEEGDDPKYRYRSLGVKEYVSKIRLAINSYKGDLHYTAEFIPAVHLKGVSFGKPKNQVQEALDANLEGEVNDHAQEDYQKVPEGVTVTLPRDKKGNGSVPVETAGTASTANGNGNAGSPTDPKTGNEDGVEISKEELLKSRTYPWSTLPVCSSSRAPPRQHLVSSFLILSLVGSRRRPVWRS